MHLALSGLMNVVCAAVEKGVTEAESEKETGETAAVVLEIIVCPDWWTPTKVKRKRTVKLLRTG